MMKRSTMKQCGVIVYGTVINYRQWIENAKAKGYCVVLCDGYATLWK